MVSYAGSSSYCGTSNISYSGNSASGNWQGSSMVYGRSKGPCCGRGCATCPNK
ncbi:MAG: hypothetical protein ABIH82_01195 [Candidatus Woesearchaeota archaeon]